MTRYQNNNVKYLIISVIKNNYRTIFQQKWRKCSNLNLLLINMQFIMDVLRLKNYVLKITSNATFTWKLDISVRYLENVSGFMNMITRAARC